MAVPNPGNLMLQKTSYMCIDPPRWSLLLGFLHEVDEAGKVDQKLEEDRQKCVEIEDVGKRALFGECCQWLEREREERREGEGGWSRRGGEMEGFRKQTHCNNGTHTYMYQYHLGPTCTVYDSQVQNNTFFEGYTRTLDLEMNRKQPARRNPWIVACLYG